MGSPEDSERYWTNRKQGSGRPRTTVNDDKKAYVEEMIVSRPTWDRQVSAGNFKRSKCESYFGSSDD